MAKEICLSLDMSFVSVMDDEGNTTSLPLNSGVKISNQNGEINISPANGNSSGGEDPETVLPVNDSLWQISYDGTAQTLYVIGVVDIDNSKTAEQHHFEIQSDDVYFRREGDNLVLELGAN